MAIEAPNSRRKHVGSCMGPPEFGHISPRGLGNPDEQVLCRAEGPGEGFVIQLRGVLGLCQKEGHEVDPLVVHLVRFAVEAGGAVALGQQQGTEVLEVGGRSWRPRHLPVLEVGVQQGLALGWLGW